MKMIRCEICKTMINDSYKFDRKEICIYCLSKESEKLKAKFEKKEVTQKGKKNETSDQDTI